MKALIVDDDADFQKLIFAMFAGLQVNVDVVGTSEDFFEQLKTTQYDFCMVDLKLGESLSGFAVISGLRQRVGGVMPIFVVSSQSDPQGIAHAIEIGATDYILKPVDREILASKIAKFIPSREMSQKALSFFPVPGGGAPVNLAVETVVRAVDEFGVELEGPHLFTKGFTVELDGPIVEEITGEKTPIRVTVVSTATTAGEYRVYRAFAEFDAANEELMRQVRVWLIRTKNHLTQRKGSK